MFNGGYYPPGIDDYPELICFSDTSGILYNHGKGCFLSIDDINFETDQNSLKMNPNPMREICIIELDQKISSPVSVSIFNVDGKQIRKMETSALGSINIEREQLKSGMYFVVVQQQGRHPKTGKLVVL